MAEGFEPYHIPQQSRRDKLRFIHLHQQEQEFISVSDHHNHHQSLQVLGNFHGGSANILAPLYDPSPDLLTCAASHGFHPQSPHLLGPSDSVKQNPVQFVKEEGVNLMGFASGGGSSTISSSSCSSSHHPVFMDSVSNPCNPGAIQDFSHHPFAYAPPNHHYHGGAAASGGDGGGVVLYKPEPLSLSHNSRLSTAAAATGQGLSLSLSSSHQAAPARNCHLLELNQGYSGSRFPGPIGPFTGYASILSGSRFLRPAQQLLDEICGLGTGISAEKMSPDSSLLDPSCEENSNFGEDSFSYNDGSEHGRKKSRLLSMLDEVYKRYRQYYQQLHTVVVSFESVAGLSNAAPFASLAIKGLSKHFRCLKNAITDQLQCSSKSPANLSIRKDQAMRPEGADEGCLYGSRLIRASGILDQPPVWRPQRGLPERAVSVLRAWLFEHFLHPYPTDTDKMMLAKQTGLSRNQVSNWFINARVRLWKPLVEEIHTLETRQAQKASQREPLLNPLPSNDMSGSPSKDEDPPPKRTRDELVELPVSLQHYNNHLCSTYMGIRGSAASSNVSLTLGLHQNNGVGLSETFPANMSHHQYGLSATSDGCVMGGQLLHDFVG